MSPATGKRASEFLIFHPTDFSRASEIAFLHALKIALQSRAMLHIMHVERGRRRTKPITAWTDFPGVRKTLGRWGVGLKHDGQNPIPSVYVSKFLSAGPDPLASMLRHFHRFPPDLVVLATHQRGGLARWLYKSIGEPLARSSGAMTLFLPREGRGFISLRDGSVSLKKILVPIDNEPDPQIAVNKASLLARGLGSTAAAIKLLHVGPGDGVPRVEWRPRAGWSCETVVRGGEVVEEITRTATEWDADLIAMATQGHLDFLDALRGSTTERVLRRTRCPILAVPVKA